IRVTLECKAMPRNMIARGEHGEANEYWARDLSNIPTSYGRLVYLAGLRNPDTGQYEYYGSDANRRVLASRVLKRLHEEIFKEWVGYALERKKADIEIYIAGIDQVDKTELIDAWLRLTPYKNLVPASIQGPERQKSEERRVGKECRAEVAR